MDSRLLPHLRCPACGADLSRPTDDQLRCNGCGEAYPIRDGAPRFVTDSTSTAEYFGYIWARNALRAAPVSPSFPYHLSLMFDRLGGDRLAGFILDGGCGEGIDLSKLAQDPACEVVGVELSGGGVMTSLARTRGLPRGHVVQGDLLQLPFASNTFDGAYSYGVVHHTPDPDRAIREIARALKPGAHLLFYVYEHFSARAWYWQLALAIANAPRVVTTRMRPALLMPLCRILAPIVYACCTVPSRHFRWAARFPYRHVTSPWNGLECDLYDRLSAPIEKRYTAEDAAALATQAGLTVLNVAEERGWMVRAVKPSTSTRH